MKKLLKRIGIIFAIFVALLIVGALLLPEQPATHTGAARGQRVRTIN
ncbi:hypothetical protein [Paraburkholderia sp.]|nr:hypothetical protein [Paraburkholderia sp.]